MSVQLADRSLTFARFVTSKENFFSPCGPRRRIGSMKFSIKEEFCGEDDAPREKRFQRQNITRVDEFVFHMILPADSSYQKPVKMFK